MDDSEEFNAYNMPENTPLEIVEKIRGMATEIRNDWNDPRSECRAIWALCDKLKEALK